MERKKMKKIIRRGKVLFLMFALLLLFGCSYNGAYTPERWPRGGVDCTKFATEYNEAERRICGGN